MKNADVSKEYLAFIEKMETRVQELEKYKTEKKITIEKLEIENIDISNKRNELQCKIEKMDTRIQELEKSETEKEIENAKSRKFRHMLATKIFLTTYEDLEGLLKLETEVLFMKYEQVNGGKNIYVKIVDGN